MENSYGVGVLNRYALFLEHESDPLDELKAREQDRERRRKQRDADKENKAKADPKPDKERERAKPPQPAPSQPSAPKEPRKPKEAPSPPAAQDQRPKPPRPRQDRPDRPERQVNGEQQPRPQRRPNNAFAPREGREPREQRDGDAGAERRGGGGGRGRGRGGTGGKREFDRRSGSDRTGVKAVDKREGGGSHNWGTHKDDLDELNKTQSEGEQTDQEKNEAAEKSGDEKPANTTAEGEEPQPPQEEEPKELTLDEYKAMKGNRQKPQYNTRKAGEGEDLSQWKDMVALTKSKQDDESDEEYDSADYPQRVGRQKRVEGIEYTFSEARRGGPGGRGGRGRGRGRGGVRAPREDRPYAADRPANFRQSAPKVNDNKDFPSLG